MTPHAWSKPTSFPQPGRFFVEVCVAPKAQFISACHHRNSTRWFLMAGCLRPVRLTGALFGTCLSLTMPFRHCPIEEKPLLATPGIGFGDEVADENPPYRWIGHNRAEISRRGR